MSAFYRLPGIGDPVTWAGRSPERDDEEAQVSIPLWMAQRIREELSKAGQAHWASCLEARIASRGRE